MNGFIMCTKKTRASRIANRKDASSCAALFCKAAVSALANSYTAAMARLKRNPSISSATAFRPLWAARRSVCAGGENSLGVFPFAAGRSGKPSFNSRQARCTKRQDP